jgi:hypothetical protein
LPGEGAISWRRNKRWFLRAESKEQMQFIS